MSDGMISRQNLINQTAAKQRPVLPSLSFIPGTYPADHPRRAVRLLDSHAACLHRRFRERSTS